MRPSIAETMMSIARTLALRATCAKLAVGAVIVDSGNRIIGTGYNGVPKKLQHCTEHPCSGFHAPKGADLCQAVHAEQNALLQCREPDRIFKIFVTHIPCMRCTKMLLNTPCNVIVYDTFEGAEVPAIELWRSADRVISKLSISHIEDSNESLQDVF
jgi:dCMP deaminase